VQPPKPPYHPPIPPSPPTSPRVPNHKDEKSALLELTGAQPSIIFGTLEDPVCKLVLRDEGSPRLESSCAIDESGGRRLQEEYVTLTEYNALKVEHDALKVEHDALKVEHNARLIALEHAFKTF